MRDEDIIDGYIGIINNSSKGISKVAKQANINEVQADLVKSCLHSIEDNLKTIKRVFMEAF